MRIAFVKTLTEAAKNNKNIMLITGDLGYSVFEEFIKKFPKQFINAGVAEQNMTGLAAGLAMEGKIPFIYSIVPFVTMRNFEQIRNDICYQNLNVKIVGVGAGFSYGPYGHTHHGLEDIGILRTLPGLTIFSPGDPIETSFVVKESLKIKTPVYIRLGRAGEPAVHGNNSQFKKGSGFVITKGKDITLIATGTMLYTGAEVAKILSQKGISVRLVSMHTIKPIDEKIILESAKKTKAIFTLEEHSIIGGLGSTVAEILAEHKIGISFKRLGVPDHFSKVIGNQEYMRKANGLTQAQLLKTILKVYEKK
ncbi:MAG TPA: transketolase C-terminal domain-containing protein [Candidatus Saccharimonadales bacterium]|nr:transketolase C-terminal domain-containing protein [Candidatus Saccharimonadales bacterium]